VAISSAASVATVSPWLPLIVHWVIDALPVRLLYNATTQLDSGRCRELGGEHPRMIEREIADVLSELMSHCRIPDRFGRRSGH
jgi:hypothetical protein